MYKLDEHRNEIENNENPNNKHKLLLNLENKILSTTKPNTTSLAVFDPQFQNHHFQVGRTSFRYCPSSGRDHHNQYCSFRSNTTTCEPNAKCLHAALIFPNGTVGAQIAQRSSVLIDLSIRHLEIASHRDRARSCGFF